MTDLVNHPPHYIAGDLQFIDVAEAFGLDKDAYLFSVLKYLLRHDRKGEAERDLTKALNYLHRRVHGRWIHEKPKGQPALYYLATPYSKFEGGLIKAFEAAAQLAARLLSNGVTVYSPISHTHPIAVHGEIDPLAHDIWLPFDEAMMRACDALLVADMPGWRESKGVTHEIEWFARNGKPTLYLDTKTLAMSATTPQR